MFKRYKNLGGNSSIECFEIGRDYIALVFKGMKHMYVYPLALLGSNNYTQMVFLAERGQGLRGYASANCNKSYSHALVNVGATDPSYLSTRSGGCFHVRVIDRYQGTFYSLNQRSIDAAIKDVKTKAGLPAGLSLGSFCQIVWTPSPIDEAEMDMFDDSAVIPTRS